MAMDIIKSYLVALGFTVNNTEFDKANRAINDLGQNVQTVSSGMAKNFGSSAVLIAFLSRLCGGQVRNHPADFMLCFLSRLCGGQGQQRSVKC